MSYCLSLQQLKLKVQSICIQLSKWEQIYCLPLETQPGNYVHMYHFDICMCFCNWCIKKDNLQKQQFKTFQCILNIPVWFRNNKRYIVDTVVTVTLTLKIESHFFAQHSGSWWCTTIPCLVTKDCKQTLSRVGTNMCYEHYNLVIYIPHP